jgi:hypothetical protein
MIYQQTSKINLAKIAISATIGTIGAIALILPTFATPPILTDRSGDIAQLNTIPRAQAVTRNVSISGEIIEGGNFGGTRIECNRLKVSFRENQLVGSTLRHRILGTGNASGDRLGAGSACLYSLNIQQPLISRSIAESHVFEVIIESDTFAERFTIKGSKIHVQRGRLLDTLVLNVVGFRYMVDN